MTKGKELIRGQGASPGVVVVTVRVVDKDLDKMAKIKPGEAMVGERFTPDHDIYLKKAAAVITDTGGILSHGPIVAREWGIPCVTGTMDGTTVLKDGQKVVVDGVEGGIYEYIPDEPVAPPPEVAKVVKPDLAEKMAELAKAKGIKLDESFLEKMRRRD